MAIEQSGELVRSPALAGGCAANEGVDLGRREFLAVALRADDIDGSHPTPNFEVACLVRLQSHPIRSRSERDNPWPIVPHCLIAVETYFEAGPPVAYAAADCCRAASLLAGRGLQPGAVLSGRGHANDEGGHRVTPETAPEADRQGGFAPRLGRDARLHAQGARLSRLRGHHLARHDRHRGLGRGSDRRAPQDKVPGDRAPSGRRSAAPGRRDDAVGAA